VNLALFTKQPLLKKALLKQIAYYANGWYVFDDNTGTNADTDQYSFKANAISKAKIVIVAKIHYHQSWQNYTSVSKKELQQILTLQKSNEKSANTIFQIFSDNTIDGYQVKKTTFDSQLMNEIGEQKLLIPETELYSSPNESQIATNTNTNANSNTSTPSNQTWLSSIETPAGTLFTCCFANKSASTSTYAKGLFSSIEAFKLSAGLPSDIKPTYITKQNYASFLFNCFTQKKLNKLYGKVAFNAKSWFKAKDLHLLYWAPLLAASIFYLLTNSYLWLKSYNIKNELAQQSSEVSQLINNRYQQDQQRQLLNFFNAEFSKTTTVHKHWSLIYQLVESGMIINRLSFSEKLISIRGKAPNASKVLTEIAENPAVKRATFKGVVRKSKGQDSFTLELTPHKLTPNKLTPKQQEVL